MANVVSQTRKIVGRLRLSQFTKNNSITINCSSISLIDENATVKLLGTTYSLAYNNENSGNISHQFNHSRSFHSSETLMSRIKWRYTHKPFFHTKKTAKTEQAPLTASNRAFLAKVLRDTYNDEQSGERYAYVVPPKTRANENKAAQNKVSPLIAELEPWQRGNWDECGVGTTRVGLIGRKVGVVPMWLKNGKPVLATMLHIEDNHIIRYIPAEDFSKTVVAQRRIRPYIMKPTASISRGSLVVGALSADPSKYTKDYCGLFTESGVMPKKKLVRFPGAYFTAKTHFP